MSEKELPVGSFVYDATTASPGTATGTARCIQINTRSELSHNQNEPIAGLSKIQAGDIVITPRLSSSMVDACKSADGIIEYEATDITSRGAVYARDRKIPAMIECAENIQFISTGNLITLDGGSEQIVHHKSASL